MSMRTAESPFPMRMSSLGATEPAPGAGSGREAAARPLQVSIRNVFKTYDGESWVVRDLDLDIPQGEFLTLLGPSGSGKTTTLMMLAGFEYPSRGDITLAGRPVADLPPERRDIGVVFQNYALFPHMTVAENVGYPLRVRRLAKTEIAARVHTALEAVQLEAFAERKPAALSGGQQQRVALARALVFEPKLVLMDEPLGALDKRLREDLQLEITRICRRFNLTVVYVTHDQSEALTMSDRVAVFNDGRVQQVGSPQEIYTHPANTFVGTFVGENNKLNGTVERIDGDVATVRLDHGPAVRARASAHVAAGARTSLLVRPEKISFDPAPGMSELRGTVRDLVFFGDEFRVHLDVGGDRTVIGRVDADTSAGSLRIGQAVTLGWKSQDAVALDCVP